MTRGEGFLIFLAIWAALALALRFLPDEDDDEDPDPTLLGKDHYVHHKNTKR